MKIVVTGANGQLGRSLQKVAGEYSKHDFVFTDLPHSDITSKDSVQSLMDSNEPNLVINCAAYTAVDGAESEESAARAINVDGVRILSEICTERRVKLIHVSTDYVFDGRGNKPLREDDDTAPLNVYGQTKLESEWAIKSSECKGAIVRTSWLYSEFGGNFVDTMLRLGRAGDTIRVVNDQIGTPTYATDLARALIKIGERNMSGVQTYHYSNEGEVSWYDFANTIFELADIDVEVLAVSSSEYPQAARRPAYAVLSKEKVKNISIKVPFWADSLRICLKEIAKIEKNR